MGPMKPEPGKITQHRFSTHPHSTVPVRVPTRTDRRVEWAAVSASSRTRYTSEWWVRGLLLDSPGLRIWAIDSIAWTHSPAP